MIYLNLLYITIIVVLLIDFSGFIDTIKGLVKRWLKTSGNVHLKPFDCSLCMSHHTMLLYALITQNLSLTVYLAIVVLSIFTIEIKSILQLSKDIIILIINKIYELLKI